MKKLLIICLVLLFCASVYSTPVGRSNIATAVADVQTDTTALIQLADDQLAQINNAGNVFYVDSSATGSGTGTSWTNAAITIKLGATKCAADNGDVLAVFPSHVETLTVADQVDIAKAGLIVFGCGVGESRPTLTYTTNGEFVIGADDVEIHNINFIAGNAVTHAIDVEAGFENFVINNCRFWTTSVGTDEFIDCIDIAAGSDNGKITNNRVEMGAASAVSFVTNVGADYTEIADNTIDGDFSTACIVDVTTASIWLNIHDNLLVNGTVGGAAGLGTLPVITLKADTSAIIVNNTCITNVATPDLAIVAADGFLAGNTYNETEGGTSSGVIVGTIAGQTYVSVVKAVDSNDADLFDVDGGSIMITNFAAVVTTQITGATNNCKIFLDADSPVVDYDFSTSVDTNGDLVGDRVVFDGTVNESVWTPLTGADNGAASGMIAWYCGEGMIEMDASDEDSAGAYSFYMTWIPYENGTTVTPQTQ